MGGVASQSGMGIQIAGVLNDTSAQWHTLIAPPIEGRGGAYSTARSPIGAVIVLLRVPSRAFAWAKRVTENGHGTATNVRGSSMVEDFASFSNGLSLWSRKSSTVDSEKLEIRLEPVLLNLGVNEMQSVANKTGGSTAIQTDINRSAVRALKNYTKRVEAMGDQERNRRANAAKRAASRRSKNLQNSASVRAGEVAGLKERLVLGLSLTHRESSFGFSGSLRSSLSLPRPSPIPTALQTLPRRRQELPLPRRRIG